MRVSWLVCLALLLPGCDGCGSAQEPLTGEVPSSDDEGAGGVAVIEGVVRLAAGAELPSYPENPMVPPPGRPEPPDECTPAQERDRQPVQQSRDGGLSGLLVALHDFATIPESEPVTHEMTITDCRLSPRLVVATRDDRLRITNETDYPFLPNFGGGMLQAVLHQRSRELELGQGGVRTLECGFAAPCGRAEIVTLYHPLHTISDETGHFRITDVPAGEELRVSAWHPLFEEASETLTLRSGQTTTVELVLTPAEITAPEPPPPREGPAEDNPDILF